MSILPGIRIVVFLEQFICSQSVALQRQPTFLWGVLTYYEEDSFRRGLNFGFEFFHAMDKRGDKVNVEN